MFRSPLLLEQARREGGEEQLEKVRNSYRFMRAHLEDFLLYNWGNPLKTWSQYINCAPKTKRVSFVLDDTLEKYHFSDQIAAFPKPTFPLSAMLPWKSRFWKKPYWKNAPNGETSRLYLAKKCLLEGGTVLHRFFMPLNVLLHEIVNPITLLVFYFASTTIHFIILVGVRFPLLWFYYGFFRSGLFGNEFLPPGENGYTKIFRGGEDINLDDLERELLTRNSDSHSCLSSQGANVIAISYKHYANKGKVPGDDGRICRPDLQALAMFIKAAAPCNVQLWIDAKLPPTSDASFERWINRGVRPYGRYITFICPSAIQYAESSFWLANEREFALAAKGVMYLEGDQIYYGCKRTFRLSTSLHRRLLQVIIGAKHSPVQVREEDRSKVTNWAMCCLRQTDTSIISEVSLCIDYLKIDGEPPCDLLLVQHITNVIRIYGPQELPIVPGRCWNEHNPLLLGGVEHQVLEFACWLGLSNDESPTTVYFVPFFATQKIGEPTVVVLEVRLDKPHFSPGKIQVTRKVLREIESSMLLDCKFVTLPWLCEWE